jgi:hypothetical protein
MLRDDYIRKYTKVWTVGGSKKRKMNFNKEATHILNYNLHRNTFANSEWINIQRPTRIVAKVLRRYTYGVICVVLSFIITNETQETTSQ